MQRHNKSADANCNSDPELPATDVLYCEESNLLSRCGLKHRVRSRQGRAFRVPRSARRKRWRIAEILREVFFVADQQDGLLREFVRMADNAGYLANAMAAQRVFGKQSANPLTLLYRREFLVRTGFASQIGWKCHAASPGARRACIMRRRLLHLPLQGDDTMIGRQMFDRQVERGGETMRRAGLVDAAIDDVINDTADRQSRIVV